MHRILAASLSLIALSQVSALQGGIDPFYENLLREGRLASDRGDYSEAVASLRLACFGLLDHPERLVEGLTLLAVAQAAMEDEAGFIATFQRILEVDDRFHAYASSDLPPGVVEAFERHVKRWIPARSLESSPGLAHLLKAEEQDPYAELRPKRRIRELKRRIDTEPSNPRWYRRLAETELELEQFADAVGTAEAILRLEAGDATALCVRGQGLASLQRCSEAVGDLERCAQLSSNVDAILRLLECYSALERFGDARQLADGLAPELVEGETQLARLVAQLPEPPAEEEPAPAEPSIRAEPDALEQARDLLARAQSVKMLEDAFEVARSIADRFPSHQDAQHLVAEIAYRASRWQEAVAYFERGGDPGLAQPRLLFYLAVAYYESGRDEAAAQALRRCLPRLQRSEYVERYIEKILGPGSVAR